MAPSFQLGATILSLCARHAPNGVGTVPCPHCGATIIVDYENVTEYCE